MQPNPPMTAGGRDWTDGTGSRSTVPVQVRRAMPADLGEVLSLLAEGGRAMAARGEPQAWPAPFPADKVAPFLDAGCVYVAVADSGAIAGTFTLVDHDPSYWGKLAGTFAHLHRMAVRRSLGGRGIGGQMVSRAAELAIVQNSPALRLECLCEATRLRRYYESFGFVAIGNVEYSGLQLALYERSLTAAGPIG